MILVYTLKNNFTNAAILSIDSSISIEKEIKFGSFVVFCDNNFKVNSVNVLNAKKFDINSSKTFYVLEKKKWKNIKTELLSNKRNLVFPDFVKFQYGKIIKREPHPKSPKLFVLTLIKDQNAHETVTLVTNTLNSTVGKVLVFANKGSITASGLPIIENEVLGVKSEGMLVGYETLGLNGNVLIFGDEQEIGKEFKF